MYKYKRTSYSETPQRQSKVRIHYTNRKKYKLYLLCVRLFVYIIYNIYHLYTYKTFIKPNSLLRTYPKHHLTYLGCFITYHTPVSITQVMTVSCLNDEINNDIYVNLVFEYTCRNFRHHIIHPYVSCQFRTDDCSSMIHLVYST